MNATHHSYFTQIPLVLYMALELGETRWKLGFTMGMAQKPRLREIAARDLRALRDEIYHAKERFKLPGHATVLSCYEAGRDGFWLHRALITFGVDNRVVDSSSIEVNRRKRRAKTDRLDAEQLLKLLIRCHQGERKVWSEVRVPAEEEENARQLHRELKQLKEEQTAHINRIKGLLTSYGVTVPVNRRFPQGLEAARTWNGRSLPEDFRQRLLREFSRMQQLNSQIRHLESERVRRLCDDQKDNGIIQGFYICAPYSPAANATHYTTRPLRGKISLLWGKNISPPGQNISAPGKNISAPGKSISALSKTEVRNIYHTRLVGHSL
jgi:hypothetical protein